MSDGHFDGKEFWLLQIADQIEQDIRMSSTPQFFREFRTETIKLLRSTARKLKKLHSVLHEYDLAVSGDTCEETFLKTCKK